MRKKILFLAVFALVYSLTSCGSSSSFEGDVKKMASYRCKAQQLSAKDPADEKAKNELEELQKEIIEYAAKMEKKYGDKKDDEAWKAKGDKIYKEEMSKCK
jgi:peptidoglycan hydrolase CwlO-like protein